MGIGLSLAKAFAKPNHHLILVARSEDKLKKVALSLEGQCAKADYFVTDLASAAGRQALLDWFKTRFQDLHVLINNAGMGIYGPLVKNDFDSIRKLFELNFFACVDLIQKFTPFLSGRPKATIINTSSIAGHRGVPLMSIYCASKFALNGLVEAIRPELKSLGIHCLNIYPGVTDTPFSENAIERGWQPTPANKRFSDSPDKVARKTYRAYLKGSREHFINFTNPWVRGMNFIAPRLVDWILTRFYHRSQ